VIDPVDVAIVETAKSYPTDGYRMVCCFVRRRLGVAVNRKRVCVSWGAPTAPATG